MIIMAKKGKGLLIATAAAGAFAYLRNPENREKVKEVVADVKDKVTGLVNNLSEGKENVAHEDVSYEPSGDASEEEVHAGFSDPYDLKDNEMVSEGAQTSVQHYEEIEDEELSDEKKDDERNKTTDRDKKEKPLDK